MNMKPSPLRNLDLSDSEVVADITAEKARELVNAYERINELERAIRELLWLIEVVGAKALTDDHRVIDAKELLS